MASERTGRQILAQLTQDLKPSSWMALRSLKFILDQLMFTLPPGHFPSLE